MTTNVTDTERWYGEWIVNGDRRQRTRLRRAVEVYAANGHQLKDLEEVCQRAAWIAVDFADYFEEDAKFRGFDREDVMQVAMIVIMRAARQFRPGWERYEFDKYVTGQVYWRVRKELDDHGPIRVPVNYNHSYRKHLKEGTSPHPEDTTAQVAMVALDPGNHRYLEADDPVLDDDYWDNTPFAISAWAETRKDLQKALSKIPERERMVLEWRYGLTGGRPKTLEEISDRLGYTRERVRQIQRYGERNLTDAEPMWRRMSRIARLRRELMSDDLSFRDRFYVRHELEALEEYSTEDVLVLEGYDE